jgi:predicted  nucleic acid-binding Zn-ribbon protein
MRDQFKETTLKGHVQLCELRYQALETRLDGLENRLVKLETDVSAIKAQMHAGFNDIKLLLEQRNTSKSNQLIATIGVLGSAALALVGYILTRS